MKASLLPYLSCPVCHRGSLVLHAFHSFRSEVVKGVLRCRSCRMWYLIDDRILELIPPELNAERRTEFATAHRGRLSRLKISAQKGGNIDAIADAKRKQSAFFDSFSHHYVLETQTFWRAYYQRALEQFRTLLPSRSLILDIGCGNGLSSAPLLRQYTVVGVDISRRMIGDAIKRADALGKTSSHYFVADAENLPFKGELFDACIGLGILHHVTSPEKTIEQISHCLKKGCSYFGHENNETFLRPFFDFFMLLFRLWEEEAGEYKLLSQNELRRICERYGLRLSVKTYIFLPPHLFNFLSLSVARRLMDSTDSFFQRIPFIRDQGGTLLFSAEKMVSGKRR